MFSFIRPYTQLCCALLLAAQTLPACRSSAPLPPRACLHAGALPEDHPPVAPSPAASVVPPSKPCFAIIGDFGADGPAEAIVARMVHSWSPQFVVTTGDNNYPNGGIHTFDDNIAKYYGRYIAFGPQYIGKYRADGRAAGDNQFFAALGNHDWREPGARVHLQALAPPGNGRYFTVQRGQVALFVVDSDKHEPDGNTADSVQALWLRDALRHSQAKHKVVVFHHPPYSLGAHGSAEWMRWPFAAWGATLVLTGHNHSYERHMVDGIPYVVNGIGGADRSALPARCRIRGAKKSVCFHKLYGAMRAWEDGDTLRLQAIAQDDTVFDEFTIP